MTTPLKQKRTLVRMIVLGLIAAIFAVYVAVQTRDNTLPDAKVPTVAAPTLEQLNSSIALAQQYLDGLYKPLGKDSAVQSEYYGLPIRVFFPATDKWSLLGEDETSTITPGPSDRFSESYTVSFHSGAIAMLVRIAWQENSQEFYVTAQPQTVRETAEVWVGETKIGVFKPGAVGRITTAPLGVSKFSSLASHRYTIRHATQQAYMYWQMRGDQEKAKKLEHFLVSNDYKAGYDMRAAILGRSTTFPDDLPYNRDAYQDCTHLPPNTPLAYAYKSKACKVLGAYFAAGERDPFLQATLALHVLQKHKSPTQNYDVSIIEDAWIQGDNPKETAQHLRQQWGRTTVGIPACTPLDCQSVASGIRTFAYGTLEAELGYHYNDPTAQPFADAAATYALVTQVTNGNVRLVTGEMYRPVLNGSFIMYWDKQWRFAPPDPSILGALALTLIDEAAMPSEYLGVTPSNSETTFDAWAFLVRYRCLKFGFGCM